MNIYAAAITLILVMDPLGNIPVFLSILKRFDAKRQRQIIMREVLAAFIILVVFMFFGQYIMHWLHLSTEALSIAGGIILFLIALKMIFPTPDHSFDSEEEEPFIVPLAVPLTAGPSALATVLLFSTRDPGLSLWVLVSITIATVFFLVVMLLAPFFMRILGRRGLVAVERLMGMLLTIVAVQMFLTGFVAFIKAH